jgi:hypothetical protein
MDPKSTIQFLSHMQRGLSQSRDTDGLVTARVTLSAGSRSDTAEAQFGLLGPEHVSALGTAQVLRRVPEDGSEDFEPNAFACIEYAVPDLPWMFSPATARNGDTLAPWIVLVVVEEQTGIALRSQGSASVLQMRRPAEIGRELPDLSESWAWAHVQCNANLEEMSVKDAYAKTPGAFLSRLICARRLKPLTRYIACVVPAYLGGVQKGLGLPVGSDPHAAAWTGGETVLDLPVFSSWRFRTSQRGDFEALVSKLSPVELAAGAVQMDLSDPGDPRLPANKMAEVTFRGALVGTEAVLRDMDLRLRNRWTKGMARILAAHKPGRAVTDTEGYDALRDDPVVAPPLWGALKIGADSAPPPPDDKGDAKDPAWFSTLNHHPEERAAAGLGAEAVRRHQEELMTEAWRQVEGLREVNRTLSQARMAAETTEALRRSKINPLSPAEATALAGVARDRMGGLMRNWEITRAPDGLVSPALSRQLRAKGPIGRRAKSATVAGPVSVETVTWFAKAPKVATTFLDFAEPGKLSNADQAAQLRPNVSNAQQSQLNARGQAMTKTNARRPHQTLGVRTLIRTQDIMTQPVTVKRVARTETATYQKQALAQATRDVLAAYDPVPVLGARLRAKVRAPDAMMGGAPIPAPLLVTPQFDTPGYTLLRAISADAVMPGVGQVPLNSVGLAQVNANFVEGWLAGANGEMAREFLWREFPGRLEGTYFRRFWDLPDGGNDIGAMSGWKAGALGQHQTGAGTDGTLVVLIKGEVLIRYPNLRVYATQAYWDDRGFRFEPRPGGKFHERRDPLFGGWLTRSTAFFAFDLGLQAAKGTLDMSGDAGWFFAFEQPDTGIQFGLDVPGDERRRTPAFWEQLDWAHALDQPDGTGAQTHVSIERGVGPKTLRYALDSFSETWGRSASAQARITLQRPMRVLLHASGMLG